MPELLDLPAVRQQVHLMSVEDYHRAGDAGVLSDDVELLHGILITKMPKSPLHEVVVQKAANLLRALVPEEFQVRAEGPLTLRTSEPEPDISVVKGKPDDWVNAHPSTAELVIEVAITSLAIDQSKAAIYAEAGIAEYWLVRPDERTVDVYRQPMGARYLWRRTFSGNDMLSLVSIPGVECKVTDILPMA